MNLLDTALVEELCRLAELCAADDRVVDEEQALILHEIVDGNELHLGDEITLGLIRRHKRARPGGCILNEGTRVGDTRCIRISESVGDARIGNTCDVIGLYHICIAAGKKSAAVVSGNLYVLALVA